MTTARTARQKEQVTAAYALGQTAKKENRSNVPHHDPALWLLIEGDALGESLPALKSWQKGWTAQNLAY